jgi:hypothetical protein
MHEDLRGVTVTAASAAAVVALDAATDAFLAHRADLPARIAAALGEDPDLVPAHLLAGLAFRLQGRAAGTARAGAHLDAARAALARRGGTAREWALAAALATWHEAGEMEAAAAEVEAVLAATPRDAVALKAAHGMRFVLGDAPGMRRAAEGALPAWEAGTPGRAFARGCLGFALGETGEPRAAERLGRAAAEERPDDLWAVHAVGHVMEAEGRAEDGLAWLAGFRAHLAAAGSFGRHVLWHAALFHLHRGECDVALDLYDAAIASAGFEEPRDFANAASLLWRIEAQGRAVGAARWQALAETAAARAAEPGIAFFEMHEVLALAAAGHREGLGAKLGAMRRRAEAAGDSGARLLAEVGLDAAEAVAALAGGAPRAAHDRLHPLLGAPLRRLGGSEAQRDLFERMGVAAALGACRPLAAAGLLTERATRRAFGAWEGDCLERLSVLPSRAA